MSYYLPLAGLGAIDFNSGTVWSQWLAGANGNNASGKLAANSIRAALGQLGYGPFTMDQSWGTAADKSGYTKFAQQQSLAPATGMPTWWPTQTGITRLEEIVKQGGTPGGGPVQEFHQVGEQIVPGATAASATPTSSKGGVSTASMSSGTKIGLVVLGLGVIGAMALMSKKNTGKASQASV